MLIGSVSLGEVPKNCWECKYLGTDYNCLASDHPQYASLVDGRFKLEYEIDGKLKHFRASWCPIEIRK